MSQRPQIRVEVVDMGGMLVDPHKHFVIQSLSKWCDVTVGAPGELMVYGPFGKKHLDFTGPKISVIGENLRPNFEIADYVIGGDRIKQPNYLRMPMWAWNQPSRFLMKSTNDRMGTGERRFCTFVYSNPKGKPRNELFCAINRRRFVEAPGAVFNNTAGDISGRRVKGWRNSKIAYLQQFNFVITAENSRHRGYITEKITDAFRAGAIPVYWGDRSIIRDFNPESFVNANEFATTDAVAEFLIELSRDSAAMDQMRSVAPMTDAQWSRNASPKRLAMFLYRAVTDLVPRLEGAPPPTSVD